MSEASNRLRTAEQNPSTVQSLPKLRIAAAITIAVIAAGWFAYSRYGQAPVVNPEPAVLPSVVVIRPLVRDIDSKLGFLGQFSAVDQVELRAQVGGTLTGIYFTDGSIVRAGDLLFTIDPIPYEIRLAQATAQLESATARLSLANQELTRAKALAFHDAGTVQNVDQRTSDQLAAEAAVDDAKAQIRDAKFDIEHCRIISPFTGRIGSHLVSIGNLIAGSRAATSPTTLLGMLVSLNPIHLDFDMSESDYLTYSRARAKLKGVSADDVEIALSDETQFGRRGKLDFVDNALDRSSGTIHARATVPNPDLFLTAGEFARVRLVVGAPVKSLLVPDAAVLPDQSEHLVLTVAPDGTVTPRVVETGDLRGGLRVIRSGLAPGDRVIIEGLPTAMPGSKVRPQDGTIRFATDDQD